MVGTKDSAAASVLIIDDTVENLRLLATMLATQGYESRPVTSGAQALRAATLDPPDLVLLDINMPEMDGYEVCRLFKANDALKHIPIIFLTALSETADKVKAFAGGAVDYVTKPFQVEEVLSRVTAHVGLAKARAELSRSYEQLRALERLRDDLVQMIVHDMRSPLSVLVANLQFVREGAANSLDGQTLEDLQQAISSAMALNRMTNDLLDVSRLEQGAMPVVRATCDLVAIAQAVRLGLAGWERSRVIEIDAAGSMEASCDASLIQRVLENLVSNAIKHTPSQGSIRIGIVKHPTGFRISVSDQGPGIPQEAKARIFEKFWTAAGHNDRGYHSVGLGLSFCKLAVEAHGGTIGVDAGATGGSVFWFDLPA